MNICLFEKSEIGKPLELTDERGQHIIKVLHKKEGDTFTAGIIDGKAGKACISKIETWEETASNGKKFTNGKIHFDFMEESDGKLLRPVSVIIGFPRPIQLKRLFRDVAGLGVKEIHLVKTELGEKSYTESDLSTPENCRRLLVEGCIQAGSTHIPQVYFHNSITECMNAVKGRLQKKGSLRIVFDNVRPSMGIVEYARSGLSLSEGCDAFAAIGSERGWTENERNIMTENGFELIGLGPRILRTETAATVGLSILMAALGCLED